VSEIPSINHEKGPRDKSNGESLDSAFESAKAESISSPEVAGQIKSTDICYHYFKSIEEKIDYSEGGEISPDFAELILNISKYQREHYSNLVSADNSIANTAPLDHDRIDEEKRAIYQNIKRINPSMPDYSNESFERALIYDIPRLAAKNGIYASPSPQFGFSQDGSIEVAEPLLRFLKIEEIKKDKVERFGETLSRDIIVLSENLEIEGEQVHNLTQTIPMGQGEFQNVLIHKTNLDKSIEETQKDQQRALDIIKDVELSRENMIFLLSKAQENQKDQDKTALELAWIGFLSKIENIPESAYKSLVEHETAHLILGPKGAIASERFKNVKNIDDFMLVKTIAPFREEVCAILGEMISCEDNNASILSILEWELFGKKLPAHKMASNWIIEKITNKVADEIDRYGVVVDSSVDVSARNQIIIQLPAVIKNKDQFNALIAEILEDFVESTRKIQSNLDNAR
jgi:hypothetical protein